MMAGRDRGTFFVPDVGDEVLVAFERGDMRLPYVIGSLWNGKDKPPSGDVAATKSIRSRSGITLRFDDTSGSLAIETPAGQRVTLQDNTGSVRVEDSNGNSVTLTTAGITIQASAKVKVIAGASVDVTASTVNVNAGMSKFSGVVQCDTMIANSVIAQNYTPGTGNIL
jgi:uncharacterized protein involved in type VI secretion and phage assembly